jgi:hypothetical protein
MISIFEVKTLLPAAKVKADHHHHHESPRAQIAET